MASAGLEVREAGRALRVQTEAPHLVSMGSGRLSTAVTLHPLPEGSRITLGSNVDADISIGGTGVEPVHCAIENDNGTVTLHPINGKTAVDGVPINSPVRLTQGCMLSVGRSNFMRFNNPAEAKRLRSTLPHSRVSITPISFSTTDVNGGQTMQENPRHHLERKPPVAPRKSPRNSCSDEEGGFLGKLSKFEMLARQNRANCVSPKVFPAGSITTNVPADQILGHSRSSSLASLISNSANNNNNNEHGNSSNNNINENSALRNLTNIDRSRSNTPMDLIASPSMLEGQRIDGSLKNDVKSSSISTTPKTHHSVRRTHLSNENLYCCENGNNENNSSGTSSSYNWGRNGGDAMTRSLTCQRTCDMLNNSATREYDMSQSLTVSSDTTSIEYHLAEKFTSNPCVRPVSKRIQPPSPAFNREPRYSEDRQNDMRVVSPTPSMTSGCSVDELRGRLHIEAENKRKRAQEERLREQELEKQEKIRLEEILAMCAEYERQTKIDKPRKPIGIKTNGSLPREKRFGGHALQLEEPRHTSKNHTYFTFETVATKRNTSYKTTSYENASIENSLIVLSNDENGSYADNQELTADQTENRRSTSLDNSMETNVLNNEEDVPSNSTSRTVRGMHKGKMKITTNSRAIEKESSAKGNASFANTSIGHYENIPKLVSKSDRNNDQSHLTFPNNYRPPVNTHDTIDNKLSISNDDLLEAIEQLSMLSKSSRDMYATPKRNNTESDNTKSNEAKADKEKKELERQARKKYIEFLQNEKLHVLSNMDALKRSVADIEAQEEEISRELELEKALLSAEYESESLKLNQDEGEKLKVQMRINELEREMNENNTAQANLQAEAKQRVLKAQRVCSSLEEDLSNTADETVRQEITKTLLAQQDILESERKAFEDLEFRHLEEEASKLATREELQRYLSELTSRIETRKSRLSHLESQRSEIRNAASKDAKSLERQKLNHLKKLEEGRNRLRGINDELGELAQNPTENIDEKRSPSREDFDRISRVTNDSPIVNDRGSLGKKTIESLKEIERNRQLHLAKQGSQVISEERRRVEELKRRVQDEVRSQWEERKMNCASFNSIESGEESSSYSTGPTESGSGSSDGTEGANNVKLSPNKLSEVALSNPGPSNDPYGLSGTESLRDEGRTSIESEGQLFGNKNCNIIEENGSRPLSQTSSEMDTLSPLQPVKHREKAKLQRPLTRYLPIKSDSLDLRHHIETAGHQLPLIYDVTVDTTSCSGYLSKMSKKFHHWNKRWFVFDRKKKTLSYYSDSSSRKARGIVYFQSIEEVYVDHMNTVRSPQPSLTFIVKTTTRLYHLMAPSPEAMRVWVDVVFTGAEGYHEFDHDL